MQVLLFVFIPNEMMQDLPFHVWALQELEESNQTFRYTFLFQFFGHDMNPYCDEDVCYVNYFTCSSFRAMFSGGVELIRCRPTC